MCEKFRWCVLLFATSFVLLLLLLLYTTTTTSHCRFCILLSVALNLCPHTTSGMVETELHLVLPKPTSTRCGDWEAVPLSNDQIRYAALDVYATILVYDCIASRWRSMPSSDGRLFHSVLQKNFIGKGVAHASTSVSVPVSGHKRKKICGDIEHIYFPQLQQHSSILAMQQNHTNHSHDFNYNSNNMSAIWGTTSDIFHCCDCERCCYSSLDPPSRLLVATLSSRGCRLALPQDMPLCREWCLINGQSSSSSRERRPAMDASRQSVMQTEAETERQLRLHRAAVIDRELPPALRLFLRQLPNLCPAAATATVTHVVPAAKQHPNSNNSFPLTSKEICYRLWHFEEHSLATLATVRNIKLSIATNYVLEVVGTPPGREFYLSNFAISPEVIEEVVVTCLAIQRGVGERKKGYIATSEINTDVEPNTRTETSTDTDTYSCTKTETKAITESDSKPIAGNKYPTSPPYKDFAATFSSLFTLSPPDNAFSCFESPSLVPSTGPIPPAYWVLKVVALYMSRVLTADIDKEGNWMEQLERRRELAISSSASSSNFMVETKSARTTRGEYGGGHSEVSILDYLV